MKAFVARQVGCFFVFLLLSMSVAYGQQEETLPLLRLLNAIPDTPAVAESYFSYVDYRALVAARPGAPLITTVEEWLELTESDDPDQSLWFAASRGIQSGSQELITYAYGQSVEAREATGIDPFSIERSISYANPPGTVTIFEGNFDDARIAAAFTANNFIERESEGLTLWCGNESCAGNITDLSSRNPANFLGGYLGRRQPLLVVENIIATSPDTERLETVAGAIAGTTPTLAENSIYADAAQAITQDGLLVQAWFMNPLELSSSLEAILASALGRNFTQEQIEALLEAYADDFVAIPQYSLLAIADTATDSEAITLVALVYNDTAEAEAAGEILVERINTYASLITQQTMTEMLEARGLTSIETDMYETAEHTVLLIKLHAPLPASEPEGDSPLMNSSMIFQVLVNMVIQRDIGWLATIP